MAASIVPLTDPDDPALAPYRCVRDRDLLALAEPGAALDGARAGAFIAEGEVVVRVLVGQRRFPVRSLLLEEKRVRAMADVLAALPDTVPAYVVTQAVMDGIVGFAIHRGVLALGGRAAGPSPDELLDGDGLVVALVGLTNHDNVGGVFRNAAAFGVRGVLLDDATCDPLYRKAVRVSVGGALLVPFARARSGDALVDALLGHGYEPVALTLRGAERLEDLGPAPRRALILGSEGPGLPDALAARCRGVRIDMAAGFDSLNVAVCSGIALYAATRVGGRA